MDKYQGLPNNYIFDCQTENTRRYVGSVDDMRFDNHSGTLRARKVTSWALCNNPNPQGGYIITHEVLLVKQAPFNQERVRGGLYPLTDEELYALMEHMRAMMPNGFRDETKPIFQSLEYARALFNRWNYQYQCPEVRVREALHQIRGDIVVRR